MDDMLKAHREFLKDGMRQKLDFSQTDQSRGVAAPPIEKPFDPGARRVALVAPEHLRDTLGDPGVFQAIAGRQSHRRFLDEPLSLAGISFLLWATQGIRKVIGRTTSLRTVPSAGARHCLETYLFAQRVEGLVPALYRYLPLEHELLDLGPVADMGAALARGALGQGFVGDAAATFVWAAIPYRMEWRYSLAAHRVILLDAGHVCQNLYLACEAIGAGTCAVAAYDQEEMDQLIGADGIEEFTVYLAPVGKVPMAQE
jgi:SagB-type dehydrogenase family enzyme